MNNITQQFEELKRKHPDALLLFRTGDFYECYREDAKDTAKILGITLTKNKDGMELAGFPYHALDSYLPKLVRAGKRIAICDELKIPEQDIKGENDKYRTSVVKEVVQPQTKDNMNSEEYQKKIAETEQCYKNKINDIARETIKALNGNIPMKLNSYYSDVVGRLNWVKLKHACGAPFSPDEVTYLIKMAEIGEQTKTDVKL